MDSKSTQVIATELTLACGAVADESINGEFSYDPADPLAVSLRMHHDLESVVWTFGRALLAEGVFEPAGDGDVHVWPCLDTNGSSVVIIELTSPDGELLLQAETRAVLQFLEASEVAVPLGAESVDVDAFLAELFA